MKIQFTNKKFLKIKKNNKNEFDFTKNRVYNPNVIKSMVNFDDLKID